METNPRFAWDNGQYVSTRAVIVRKEARGRGRRSEKEMRAENQKLLR